MAIKNNIWRLKLYGYNLMVKAKTKIRRWGDSLGIVIPSNLVKDIGCKPGDEVEIELRKSKDILDLFGKAKFGGIDTQKMKDEMRAGWRNEHE
jgi:antitoxin component of MazEF toxin-antitoxin module